MTLHTSPNSIMRWLGIGQIRRSDNLKIPAPEKARLARIFWAIEQAEQTTDNDGPGDAA